MSFLSRKGSHDPLTGDTRCYWTARDVYHRNCSASRKALLELCETLFEIRFIHLSIQVPYSNFYLYRQVNGALAKVTLVNANLNACKLAAQDSHLPSLKLQRAQNATLFSVPLRSHQGHA